MKNIKRYCISILLIATTVHASDNSWSWRKWAVPAATVGVFGAAAAYAYKKWWHAPVKKISAMTKAEQTAAGCAIMKKIPKDLSDFIKGFIEYEHLYTLRDNNLPTYDRIDTIASWSDSANKIASNSHGWIKVWDLSNGQSKELFGSIGSNKTPALAPLPNNKLAFTAPSNERPWDRCIKICDLSSGQCTTLADYPHFIDVLIPLSENRLASAGSDIRIWNLRDGQCIQALTGHTDTIHALASLKDDRLASAGLDSDIRIWNLRDGQCIQTLTGHTDTIHALASLKDDRLASAGYDSDIRIWDLRDGKCTQTLTGHTGAIGALVPLEGNKLASAGRDKTIRIWDLCDGKCTQTLTGNGYISTLAKLPNNCFASAGEGNEITIWGSAYERGKRLAIQEKIEAARKRDRKIAD